MTPIVTLTLNPALDATCSVAAVVPERKLDCSAPKIDPGGGGVNVARAVHLLGGQVTALWTRGGGTGQMLEARLARESVTQWPIPIHGETRYNLTVFEESSGEQFRFGMPGPTLGEEDTERCIAAARELDPPPRYLVLSGHPPPGMPADVYARIVRASSRRTHVVLDTRGAALERALHAGGLFLIKPNVGELAALVGRSELDDESLEGAARQLIHAGRIEVVVVSLGAGGAVAVTASASHRVRSPTVPIRSKVGAGDSMVAGMVLALSRGARLPDAVRFGVACGAAAVMTPGTALCRREDAERLYAAMS